MSNELKNTISRSSNGVFKGVAIGGKRELGSRFFCDPMFRLHDALGAKILLFLARSVVRMEPGEKVAKLLNPRWCVGTCACCLVVEVQFGHAGAQDGGVLETAASKNKDMKESGIRARCT